MRHFLSILFIAFCSMFCSPSVSAQTISKSDMPEVVKMFKAQLPKPIDKAMVMKSCYLRNGDSEMVIEFTLDPSHYGITSSDMIQGFNELTPTDRKKFLGQEFTQMAQLLPVPIYAIFIFPDGQKYNMRLSE